MSTTNQLSTISTLAGGDLFPIYDISNSDTRKVSLSELLAYMQSSLSGLTNGFTPQYEAPAATGFSVSITDSSINTWLILSPLAGYAAGTVVLPATSNSIAGQEFLFNCTQAITSLTVDGNGSTVVGAPTTISANDYFRLKYDIILKTWYRVG